MSSHYIILYLTQIEIADMSVGNLRCCLHTDSHPGNDRIVLFNETTIQKCREKRDIRIQLKRKSKYSDIVLPDVIDQTTGYHSQCYKSYCAIGFSKIDSSSSIETSVSKSTDNGGIEDEETAQLEDGISDSKYPVVNIPYLRIFFAIQYEYFYLY